MVGGDDHRAVLGDVLAPDPAHPEVDVEERLERDPDESVDERVGPVLPRPAVKPLDIRAVVIHRTMAYPAVACPLQFGASEPGHRPHPHAPRRRQRRRRGGGLGAAAAAGQAGASPAGYDDVELLGKAVTRGDGWYPIGFGLHMGNGALFGAVYANVAPALPIPPALRGPGGGPGRAPGAVAAGGVTDRLHPARDDLPRLSGNRPAFLQAAWRHLLFGFVLGELERRVNAEPERRAARAGDRLLQQRARLAGARRLGPRRSLTARVGRPGAEPHAGADHRRLGVRRVVAVPGVRGGRRRGGRPLTPRLGARWMRARRAGRSAGRRRGRRGVRSAAPDVVYHLAALSSVGRSWEAPGRRRWATTIAGSVNLLEAMRHARAGGPGRLGQLVRGLRGAGRHCRSPEDAPLRPANPYAVSKASGELLAEVYADAYGLQIVRVAAVQPLRSRASCRSSCFLAGPSGGRGPPGRVRPRLRIVTGNPDTRRDFTDVRDVVRAYRLLARPRLAPAAVYNVSSGRLGVGGRPGGAARRAGGADRGRARRRSRARARARGDGPARRPLPADRM